MKPQDLKAVALSLFSTLAEENLGPDSRGIPESIAYLPFANICQSFEDWICFRNALIADGLVTIDGFSRLRATAKGIKFGREINSVIGE